MYVEQRNCTFYMNRRLKVFLLVIQCYCIVLHRELTLSAHTQYPEE